MLAPLAASGQRPASTPPPMGSTRMTSAPSWAQDESAGGCGDECGRLDDPQSFENRVHAALLPRHRLARHRLTRHPLASRPLARHRLNRRWLNRRWLARHRLARHRLARHRLARRRLDRRRLDRRRLTRHRLNRRWLNRRRLTRRRLTCHRLTRHRLWPVTRWSECRRLRVYGRTSPGQRPRSTASAHASLFTTSGLSIS